MSRAAKETRIDRPGGTFDLERLRADFPILTQQVHGRPLVYLDNAATTQKPNAVIEALNHYYRTDNANIHRGVHTLSERATSAYEGARATVRQFINAASDKEIVFVRGTTEGVNLVASSWGRTNVRAGDEVLITTLEHHANIVPWQMLCAEVGATLRVVPITDSGELIMEEFERLLSERTRMVAVTQCSNAIGTVTPIERIIARAHAAGAVVLVDGAQAVAHVPVDVRALDCDFYAFSSHKLYGPTGIGVLYGKERLLEAMPPYQGGGDMIKTVTFEKTTYNDLPHKFEAGTPHIAGAIGLGAAIDYVNGLDRAAIGAHERDLLDRATRALLEIPGARVIGTARAKIGILSFTLDGAHPHDIGTVLDHEGVAIRTGHHCAMPLMQRLRLPATARASFACYNTRDDVDALIRGIRKVREMFG
jgi:cysteine desulfurase/selenocysteine lyase